MPRKKIHIDWEIVNELLEAGCNGQEVSAYLGVTDDTLNNRCKEVYKLVFSEYAIKYKNKGNGMLRIAQFKSALAGNVNMQIWLGKQRLNQYEQIQATSDLTINIIEDDD